MEAIIKYSNCYPIINKEYLSSSVIKFKIKADEIASISRPGQFVQIRTSDDYFPLWPRPFSIHDADSQKGVIDIIFRISGLGTSKLAQMNIEQKLHVFGPLGNGFPNLDKNSNSLLVAGGVGLPPLYFLAKRAIRNGVSPARISMISGARNNAELFAQNEITELGIDLQICTDDGSKGTKGTAVDLLGKKLSEMKYNHVYSCGPSAMLQKIDQLLINKNLQGFFSLEALMPCGYGICSGCAIKTIPSPDCGPTDDKRDYHLKRVCYDGPVFKSGEVMWE